MLQVMSSEHREVVPGVWLPMRIEATRFDENTGKSVGQVHSKVVEVEANDELGGFAFVTKPGMLQLTQDRRPWRQVERGGRDLLEERAKVIRERGRKKRLSHVYGWHPVLGAAVITIILVLVVGAFRRAGCKQ